MGADRRAELLRIARLDALENAVLLPENIRVWIVNSDNEDTQPVATRPAKRPPRVIGRE